MKRGLMIAGLLVVGITVLGMAGSALAEDHVCYEQSAPMTGMTGPGMVRLPHAPWGEMGLCQRLSYTRARRSNRWSPGGPTWLPP